MTTAKRIAVFTGTRAEYGLLRPLMTLLRDDEDIELLTIVTGTHLEASHGSTVSEILNDGFRPDVEIPLGLDAGTSVDKACAECLVSVSAALQRLEPEVLVILGDRYEALSAAVAATLNDVPIAHIHGGELTEGAMDDAFRHAITKMAHLHFVAAPAYRDRVIQLGEHPDSVYLTGAPGVDTILSMQFEDKAWLESEIGFQLGVGYFLVTYHPVTRGQSDQSAPVRAMLDALRKFADHKLVITGTNADPGADVVSDLLHEFASAHPDTVLMRPSLGQLRYLTAMKWADAVIGNSSSGIIEAPSLGVPTVNIGPRQEGRQKAESVLDCDPTSEAIENAIRHALAMRQESPARTQSSLHGDGTATKKTYEVLKTRTMSELPRKSFYDHAPRS